MSTTLFFLLPLAMLAVVWSMCFVGCVLPTGGLPGNNTTFYSDLITKEVSLIAYWPLNDPIGSTNAFEFSENHPGTYTIPPAYVAQSTPFTVPAVALQQTTLIPGDGTSASTNNLTPASVDFEGGYVSIPWSTQSPPVLSEFTLEAWIQPGWTGSGLVWTIFSANTANSQGFSIRVDSANNWDIVLENGSTGNPSTSTTTVDLTTATYVAVTFSAGTLMLWVNPTDPTTATQTFPNVQYTPVATGTPATFFIGAGGTALALRTQPGGAGGPINPFEGMIQSVALYSSALSGTDIVSHFAMGNAN